MDENLYILVAAYEDEKKVLEEIIRQYLREEDLKYAYQNQKALMRVNKNIRTLKVLENPFFEIMEMQHRLIKYWEEQLAESQQNRHPTDYIIENLEHHKRELAKLEAEHLQSKPVKTVNAIDQAFSELFGCKIKYLKIHITRQEVFYFKFTYTRKKLQITIPFIKGLCKTWILNKQNVKALIILGFTLSKSGNRLSMSLKGDNEQILFGFKTLFSRIMFDVFHVSEFRDQSFIEYGPSV
jgi:hypothetical protein